MFYSFARQKIDFREPQLHLLLVAWGENVIEGELSSVTFNKKIRQKDLAILLTKLGHKGCCIFLDNLKKFLQKY